MAWIRAGATVAALSLCIGVTCTSRAAGTAAGASIRNTAQVTYTVGGANRTAESNTAAVIVAEILDVVVAIASTTVPVAPGAVRQELVFTITNTGNGSEAFALTGSSAGVAGDDFDPALASPGIYFDSDDSGDLSAADVAYVAGSNDPVLPADGSTRVLLVNDIPASALDGQRGRSQLTVRAVTGVGDPGTAFSAAGDGGIDAVAGTSGGDAALTGEYVVATFQLAASKSQSVLDPFGGSRALPGARITYQVLVTAAGSGTAGAVVFTDPIPANTTYVAGSLKLNGTPLTDAADADPGQLTSAPSAGVRVTLGDLTAGSAPQAVEFAVTID